MHYAPRQKTKHHAANLQLRKHTAASECLKTKVEGVAATPNAYFKGLKDPAQIFA